MDRRAFLAWTSAGVAGSLAGCVGAEPPEDGAGNGTADSPTTGVTGTAASPTEETVDSVAGVELPVPEEQLSVGAGKDAIPAITEPAFAADWSEVEGLGLAPDDEVLGVTRGSAARAYPLRVLEWHEVVNDSFRGPLLVTYCPLCASGLAAERRVNGEATIFGVSGLLWNSNLVMYDELTTSLWSQIAATAIRGPETGTPLSLVPARQSSWETWQADHPETEVMLPPPHSDTIRGTVVRDYDRQPYAGYATSDRIGIGENDQLPASDVALHPKTQVLGVTADGVSKAYPLPAVREAGVVNDTVGELPVVVTVAPDGTTLVGYVRRVGGETLTFARASETHLRADGSRWGVTSGRAVDGPHEGTVLEPAADRPQEFWFAWLDFHPETAVYEADQ